MIPGINLSQKKIYNQTIQSTIKKNLYAKLIKSLFYNLIWKNLSLTILKCPIFYQTPLSLLILPMLPQNF